jgi:hypothetical protein
MARANNRFIPNITRHIMNTIKPLQATMVLTIQVPAHPSSRGKFKQPPTSNEISVVYTALEEFA